MHLIWLSRPDLQAAFDIKTQDGQSGFIAWYESASMREYGLVPNVPSLTDADASEHLREPSNLYFQIKSISRSKARYFKWLPLRFRRWFKESLLQLAAGVTSHSASKTTKEIGRPGATLIGYAHGVLGMGEHVRMTAEALAPTDVDFGIYDFSIGVENRQVKEKNSQNFISDNRFKANIFHVNADQMLTAYTHLGPDFFRNRYNIGFWAWELEKCPDNWLPVLEMVDEIWAPSRFIQQAFSSVTEKPVIFMPLCVELPNFSRRTRRDFNLPEDLFLFLFMFDFMSYIDRKNPLAAIRAFRSAFPDHSEKAGLVLKVMNALPDNPKWQEMLAAIDGDPRIHVVNTVMSRSEVLALVDTCDSFVSLHRSEGFGRGPAEAMYLGKPVIVTNYSGNTDFTKKDNSLLVDFELIDVLPGQYVFEHGQQWADADFVQAGTHMRSLFDDRAFAEQMGRSGQEFIKTQFDARTTGGMMCERLKVLGLA